MHKKTFSFGQFIFNSLLILGLLLPVSAGAEYSAGALARPEAAEIEAVTPAAPTAASWCVAGSFQGWDNTSTPLYDDGSNGDLVPNDGLFSLDYNISSSGDYEFKIVECGNWSVAFPANNAWFTTHAPDIAVKFTFDTTDHSGDAGIGLLPAQNIVNVWGDTLPASFTAVGDFNGWNNADPATMLANQGNGIYQLFYSIPSAGSYIGKITTTGAWRAFGADGRSVDAANLSFTTSTDGEIVVFWLDANTGRLTIAPNGSGAGNWCVAGSFQGWDNASTPLYDDGTNGDLFGGDGVFSRDYVVPTAGRSEFKAVECGNWGNAYPPNNSWVITAADNQTVKFTFDTNDHSADAGLPYLPNQNIVNAWYDDLPAFTAVGDFQGWNNADPATALADLGYGMQFLSYPVASPGSYQGKVTSTGGWDNQFDAAGRNKDTQTILFQIFQAKDQVRFILDTIQGRLAVIAPPQSGHSHDNNVEYNGLGHASRDGLYRVPFGAVTPGNEVLLRFRTYHNDVERVRVRFWDSKAGQEYFGDMSIAASDVSCFDQAQPGERCDFWQLAFTPADLNTLWYRFIIQDGTATAYYADDRMMDGGWGVATPNQIDNSYAITVYDPGFQPVEWMQNAVAYQVFPDRFRNGRSSNDPTGNETRYAFPPDPNDQIIKKSWGELPEGYCRNYFNPAQPCTEGPRGRDYFGGDLVGIRSKLPYLKQLGVKVIYLNPVFEAGSNHAYDTQDYSLIDHFFGDTRDFLGLVEGAHRRGIKVILDGVFNHVSSDSPYFDRYGHYDVVGACESLSSPYRDWFTFHEVTPGAGKCAGQGGPNSADYDGWFGFDSIPVLNKYNPEVQALIFDIARYWLGLGADGWRLDVMPDPSFPPGFWQQFRQVVLDAKPDAIIIGELWKKGDVLPLIHGDEADTTMNYRFRNAILGFFGKVDNKGFPDDGQSDQPPSLFASKLESIHEDYPDAAYYTLLNLMDSHDTQRILWSLTPGENNREDKEFNPTNLDAGRQMLRMAAIVQMTIPGAPTIYYGDEVGVTGDDDPDDRRTFPWQDTGFLLSPGNEKLKDKVEGAAGDLGQLMYYRRLTNLRNSRPVFRDGALTFLLADDANRTMAYLMRTEDDLAIVALNRSETTQTLHVDVSYHMPWDVRLTDVLGGLGNLSALGGVLTFDLPALSATVLLPAPGQDLAAPAAPANLAAAEGDGQVTLSWEAVPDTAWYVVLRSPVTRGGYEGIEKTTDTTFTDSTVENGKLVYYAVQAVDTAGNISPVSNEAAALPHYNIGWANLQWPPAMTHIISVVDRTDTAYGQVWIDGVTGLPGPTPTLWAQLGFGPEGSNPDGDPGWAWLDAAFNVDAGNNDEFMASMLPEAVGVYDYVYRYSTTGGRDWLYADLNGPIPAGNLPPNPGKLTVVSSGDTTPPDAPANLQVTAASPTAISLAWEAVSGDPTLYGYEVLRGDAGGGPYAIVALVTGTTFDDLSVVDGATYYYVVRAVDLSYNRSGYSNEVSATAEKRTVTLTFNVTAPSNTPDGWTVYIAGTLSRLDGGYPDWNPGAVSLTQAGPYLWTITFTGKEDTQIEYKYTLGSWDYVEKGASCEELSNRVLSLVYGSDGNQVVNDTVLNWRNVAPCSGLASSPSSQPELLPERYSQHQLRLPIVLSNR